MTRSTRLVAFLLGGLAIAGLAGWLVVHETTRRWFERDARLRAELAVSTGRHGLVASLGAHDAPGTLAVLHGIARDPRFLGAAACGADGARVATEGFPALYDCGALAGVIAAVRRTGVTDALLAHTPRGTIFVSVVPVVGRRGNVGAVVTIEDFSYVASRQSNSERFFFAALAALALAASITTWLAGRTGKVDLRDELRQLLVNDDGSDLATEVRALVERYSATRDPELEGEWGPERLRQTLARHFHGESVVVVANREPYIHERQPDESVRILHPASGLVTALEPVMRACSGTWIAHGSGSADREMVDAAARVRVPPGEESYTLRRVWLTPEEEAGYYYGLANEALWPLCHIAHARPLFRGDDWRHYRTVNQRFADAVCAEVSSDDPIVLVQDYHFALAPKLIRERLPRATILTFWHIPWPNAERFGICPWRDEIIDGLLGSSILGFHTRSHCLNFIDSADRFVEARIDRETSTITRGGRPTLVRPYPISLEWPVRWTKDLPPAAECRASVLAELGLPPDTRLGIGVDRLDYTKGVEERFLAVERLLEREPSYRGKLAFVQLAAPSRTRIERYQELDASVEHLVGRINARFGTATYKPIHLLRAHHEPPTVFRYYRAADFCYVSSLHDGMNLVAKEFVAARDDERGVLVLSQFTGASRELGEALLVNPYDLDEASGALARALTMPGAEQRDRMRAMRALIAERNVFWWIGRMLLDAARVRRRDRLPSLFGRHALDSSSGRGV